jgi:hypothetical protein
VELGYLTKEKHLVIVDSLGQRILDRALEFLTFRRPMEPLGSVGVTVFLHRHGWGKPGELLLRPSQARFYRTRTSHLLVGEPFTALRKRGSEIVLLPTFTPSNVPAPPMDAPYPGRKGSFFVVIPDGTVKAVRARGRTVEMFGVEPKEFTELILGKLQVRLEFPTAEAAASFARDFPRTEDPATLDPSVAVDVDRSRKVVWDRRMKLSWAGFAAAFGLILVLPGIYLVASGSTVGARGIGVASALLWPLVLGVGLRQGVEKKRQEHRDLEAKWPRLALERLGNHMPGYAGAFAAHAKEIGIPLQPDLLEVKSLDGYVRGLAPATFFPPFAWGAAAYVGQLLLARLGRDVPHQWRYHAERQELVLWFEPIQLWISPYHALRRIWVEKLPETLDEFIETMAEDVLSRFAVSDLPGFLALGFVRKDWDEVDDFIARVKGTDQKAAVTTHVVGDNHFHRRTLAFGDFELQILHIELEQPSGTKLRPAYTLPFCRRTQAVRATIDASAPLVPHREDAAVVRLAGNELVPLGVQLYNYVELGPNITAGTTAEIDLLAVADEATVVTPRMRETRSEAKDFLAPREPNAEGVPTNPYATFLGRILAREELVNPIHGLRFHRITLDIAGFRLAVLVRQDKCDGVPDPGHYLSGSVWLLGRLAPGKADTRYIG